MAIVEKVTIEIGGNKVPGFLNLTIHQNFNQIHDFQLVCRRDAFEQLEDSPLSSSIDKIGSVITFYIEGIDLGDDTSCFFFKGIITEISTSESLSNHEIIFSGNSPDILLHGYPTSRSFENMNLKQIVQEVIKPYPQDQISLRGDPVNDGQFPYIVQYKETNYEFIRRISARIGEWFFYDGEKLVFGNFAKESIKGFLGINISHFSVKARIVPLTFKVERYLYHSHRQSEDCSSNYDITNSLNKIGNTVYDQSLESYPEESVNQYPYAFIKDDGSFISQKPGIRLADREKQMLASKMVVASGSCDESLVPGNILQVKSLNNDQKETDIGDFLVTSVHHRVDNSLNYNCSFIGFPAENKISPESNIYASAMCETQSAFVTDNNDPQKLGRVKVRFFWQTDGQSSPWIRSVHLYGGSGYGSYFVPEINSEVLVGFEGGDPQLPYIIGPLNNSEWKPDGDWVSSSNDIKTIRSRSGHTVEFNDKKGSEELCIYTGSKKDPTNMMRLKVSNNGYEIFSKGPINMTSEDNINIKGKEIHLAADESYIHGKKVASLWSDVGGEVMLSSNSTTALQLKDNNITIQTIDGKFAVNAGGDERIAASVEGTVISGPEISIDALGTAKIAANGLVTIKGALVEIN
jgi:type VI secretion system secreted protein VgrG